MRGDKILVVDDSPTELRVVTAALENSGYRIVTAVDGEEAMAKALSEKPKLIILDVVMPKKNGFQTCRALKTSEDTKGIPVMLLTSKNLESDKFWGMKQGADEYLTKPFDTQQLLAAVSRFA
jgi:twitching motility two-component system response regulator PilH